MQWIDAAIQGVLLGGLYAQYALGMSLMFGVMRIVNTAHGDLLILLSFAAIGIAAHFSIGPHATMLVLVPMAAVGGYALQRLVLNRAVGSDPLPSLIATFGLSITIQNSLLAVFTADARSLPGGGLESASLAVGPLYVGLLPVQIFCAALLLTGAIHLLMRRSRFGRALRAAAADADAASMVGVNARHVYAGATALAVGVLGVAAVFHAIRVTVSPADGPGQLIYAFEAVIIGGMGSLWGAFLGALLLGVAQVVGGRIDAGWGSLAGHVVFLAVLAIRPQGLFGKGGS